MNIQPQSTQPISDDQELAKVLAGVNGAEGDTSAADAIENPVPIPSTPPPSADPEPADSDSADATAEPVVPELPPMPEPAPSFPPATPDSAGDLDGVKQEAINELRPLVDKLNLVPEEKFDTYLLLIRSTDDRTLVAPAHEAAKQIADESRRAQALLDIIKEIDFLSGAQPQA